MKSSRNKEKMNTEFEMGGLREERFGGSGRGVENTREGWGNGDGWGDGSKMGSLMEEEKHFNIKYGAVVFIVTKETFC